MSEAIDKSAEEETPETLQQGAEGQAAKDMASVSNFVEEATDLGHGDLDKVNIPN